MAGRNARARSRLHGGKITGLAAFGEPVLYRDLAQHFTVDDRGRVRSTWIAFEEMRAALTKLLEGAKREDAAASIQTRPHPRREFELRRVFIVPPMGDEGLLLGAGLGFLLSRDGLHDWLDRRYRLDNLSWGRDY